MTPEQTKIDIDTLILSDIHLGFDLARVKDALAVLRKYKYRRLILNGDIFHGMDFKRLNRHHWHVLSAIRRATSSSDVIWIKGNHDHLVNILSNLLGVRIYNQYTWTEKGTKFICIHGHQFDRFISRNALISKLAVYLYNRVRRKEGKYHYITNFIKARTKSWLRLSSEVADGAISFALAHKANVIICGHTHLPMKMRKNGVYYYNGGSWVESPCSYITITGTEVKIEKID